MFWASLENCLFRGLPVDFGGVIIKNLLYAESIIPNEGSYSTVYKMVLAEAIKTWLES